MRSELRFPVEGGYYDLLVGCDVYGKRENFAAAGARIAAASIPAEVDQLEEWLALLQIATAGGRKSEATQAVALRLYAGALREYPADVAKAACERLARTERWFPPLVDLLDLCEKLVKPRRMMAKALP